MFHFELALIGCHQLHQPRHWRLPHPVLILWHQGSLHSEMRLAALRLMRLVQELELQYAE
jgi:hypothetical protein